MRNPRCPRARLGFVALMLHVTVSWVGAAGTADSKLKYEEPTRLRGTIYERGADEPMVLFHFERVATRIGNTLDVVRTYTYPDGSLAARERAVYHGDQWVDFQLDEAQNGAEGSARIVTDGQGEARSGIEFRYKPPGSSRTKSRHEPLLPNTVINDMVATFIVSHWDALMQGDQVDCRYTVVPRTETVRFRFQKVSDTTWRDQPVVIIRMEPHHWLIRLLVEPLYFTFEKDDPHRCLKYTGRTTPKRKVDGDWEDLDAVTVFDWPDAE